MGAWIEISERLFYAESEEHVAPLVGAWIEIGMMLILAAKFLSLPSWERGLKSVILLFPSVSVTVAPLVGAWIEIPSRCPGRSQPFRRSPRGSVD